MTPRRSSDPARRLQLFPVNTPVNVEGAEVHTENTSSHDLSQAALPSAGRFLFSKWAELLQVEERALNDNVRRSRIRVLKLGAAKFIDATWFWEDLSTTSGESEE